MDHGKQGERTAPRVLIVYYSFSGQTNGLLNHLAAGLKEQGIRVAFEKIRPVRPLRFPIGTISSTVKMMLVTFVRRRIEIRELTGAVSIGFDLAILAGPTWSYNPSGPVLSFLDLHGRRVFEGKQVLPLISCRGYWRMHWYTLKKKLRACGGTVPNLIVFSHPCREPWRTVGVFLKLAGKVPERSKIMGRYYKKYGHSKEQFKEARNFGALIADAIKQGKPLAAINFKTPLSLP